MIFTLSNSESHDSCPWWRCVQRILQSKDCRSTALRCVKVEDGNSKVWKNVTIVTKATAEDRIRKVKMILLRGVFRYHSYKASPREGTVIRMFHLHADLDHGAYSCRQRHQLKSRAVLTRGVEVVRQHGHLSGVALCPTTCPRVDLACFVKYRKDAVLRPAEKSISTTVSAYASAVSRL